MSLPPLSEVGNTPKYLTNSTYIETFSNKRILFLSLFILFGKKYVDCLAVIKNHFVFCSLITTKI